MTYHLSSRLFFRHENILGGKTLVYDLEKQKLYLLPSFIESFFAGISQGGFSLPILEEKITDSMKMHSQSEEPENADLLGKMIELGIIRKAGDHVA